jgi:predicted ribosomally synthesized peptide with nif11-like leader
MGSRKVLNSQEAAELLGLKHFMLLNYARRRIIPGKIIGNEWRFEKSELLAWLKDMGVSLEQLEVAIQGARGFVQRLRFDSQFRQTVEALSTQDELLTFAKQEGFLFTPKELQEALKGESDADREEIIPRKSPRYQAVLEISEVNGNPVTDTYILDFSNSGARIGSATPLDYSETIVIAFTLPGEREILRLGGRVVWSRFDSLERRYHTGVEFSIPIDQLYRQGKI